MKVRIGLAVVMLHIPVACAWAQSATQFVTIRRHPDISFTNVQADKVLKDASTVLQVDDDGAGAGDIACNVKLSRTMDVRDFASDAPSAVNSAADGAAVHAEDSFVKIVDSITSCGGIKGSYAGCTKTPGRSMIVVASENGLDIVWAHEFGHATGLQHRNAPKAVMTGAPLASDQKYLNQKECDSYINGPPITLSTINAPEQPKEKGTSSDGVSMSLLELAHAPFSDRVPYSLIQGMSNAQMPALLSMLSDLREQDSWANVVTIAGIVGDPEMVSVLNRFLDSSSSGGNPSAIFRSKAAALIALGYLAHRFPDSDALASLIPRTNVDAWATAGPWVGETLKTRAAKINSLREVAMIGIALSGRQEALPWLTAARVQQFNTAKSADRNKAFAGEILETHGKVSRVGLEQYYSD
jgi:hypothetical protein